MSDRTDCDDPVHFVVVGRIKVIIEIVSILVPQAGVNYSIMKIIGVTPRKVNGRDRPISGEEVRLISKHLSL